MIRRPPRSTLFPYTTLFRSIAFTGIPVTDMKRARAFYEGVLALRVSGEFGEGVWIEYEIGKCNRSEEHTSELQSQSNLVCRLLLEKKKTYTIDNYDRLYSQV